MVKGTLPRQDSVRGFKGSYRFDFSIVDVGVTEASSGCYFERAEKGDSLGLSGLRRVWYAPLHELSQRPDRRKVPSASSKGELPKVRA